MSMYALQKRIWEFNVTIHSLHPGVIKTNIQQHMMDNTWLGWLTFSVAKVLALPPIFYFLHKSGIFRGADAAGLSIVYMAVSPKLAGSKMLYYDETVPRATSAESMNEELQEQLIDYSLKCVKDFISDDTLKELRLQK